MTIRHLRVFLAVCRAQSVTQAAQTLHVTQPAVSRAVQELERHYGVRLFERLNHRLFLTESGRELYQQALHAVEAFDRMEQSMRSWEEDGVLRVGAGVTLGATLLPRAAAEMQRRHSRLRLTAQVANGETLRRALLQGELDLALVEDGAAQPPLERRVLADDCLTPLLPPDCGSILRCWSAKVRTPTATGRHCAKRSAAGRCWHSRSFPLRCWKKAWRH